ncbi:hypothetical protein THEYE_A0290 [Thermodesulfovibrio yellowstonii DSM 11347]|uniref:Uncharacterized protein n=1 Tax=Thermodesulfovibrio yellowstonii (strain ATCC 51303 / DSM 11347 / YP87) TaxID=289376 RepID=B5YIH9_THEYD|nr:hypothetical protein THEYE_A0290 [Thermodesulfovibrio yellowstonii DSM 11347]
MERQQNKKDMDKKIMTFSPRPYPSLPIFQGMGKGKVIEK